MDSCEFIKNIQGDMLYILRWFDAIIALYNILGVYRNIDIRAVDNQGVIEFNIQSSSILDVDQFMRHISHTQIDIFSHVYIVHAEYDISSSNIILRIHDK